MKLRKRGRTSAIVLPPVNRQDRPTKALDSHGLTSCGRIAEDPSVHHDASRPGWHEVVLAQAIDAVGP
jgi:hypothetical protein